MTQLPVASTSQLITNGPTGPRRKSKLPPVLRTCLDAELDETTPITDKAKWRSYSLPPELQPVLENVDFHHKYQEQLVKLLEWIAEHPNENPPIEEFGSMLDPVDPNTPNQVKCPKRGCGLVKKRVHIVAHMLQSDHAGLPVYYCIYGGKICQGFYHAADRDRHREKKHNIPRPRVAKQSQAKAQTTKSKPYSKQPKTANPQTSVQFTAVPSTIPSGTHNIVPGPITYTSSSMHGPIGTTQQSHRDGSGSPSNGQGSQKSTGSPIDLNSPWAPMGINQVPNISENFSSSSNFYSPTPWTQPSIGRYFPQNLLDPNHRRINPSYTQAGLSRTPQAYVGPNVYGHRHSVPEAGPSNAREDQSTHYSNPYHPAYGQNTPQRHFGGLEKDSNWYPVGLHSPRNHACRREIGCSHVPFSIILTILGLLASVMLFLCYKGHLGTLGNEEIINILEDIGSSIYRFIVILSSFHSLLCVD